MSVPSPEYGSSSRSIITHLNQEWQESRWELATWGTRTLSLDAILESIRFNPDLVLRELITACQAGHSLAGRTIVQALLPKLILMSRSTPYPAVEDMLSALWIRLARYPLAQRPTSIAANLVLDTRKDAIAEQRVRMVVPSNRRTGPEMTAESILDVARCLGLATPESLSIMEKVYLDGLPSTHVASLFQITPEAVRRRCCDTMKALRENRNLLAEYALTG